MYTGKDKLIRKVFSFLIEDVKVNYCFQSFEKDITGTYWGPMDAYSFYNESGCFTIYNVVQLGIWSYYYSKKFSINQKELLEKCLDIWKIEKEIWDKERYKLFYTIKKELKLLAEVIKINILKHNEFYNIKV